MYTLLDMVDSDKTRTLLYVCLVGAGIAISLTFLVIYILLCKVKTQITYDVSHHRSDNQEGVEAAWNNDSLTRGISLSTFSKPADKRKVTFCEDVSLCTIDSKNSLTISEQKMDGVSDFEFIRRKNQPKDASNVGSKNRLVTFEQKVEGSSDYEFLKKNENVSMSNGGSEKSSIVSEQKVERSSDYEFVKKNNQPRNGFMSNGGSKNSSIVSEGSSNYKFVKRIHHPKNRENISIA